VVQDGAPPSSTELRCYSAVTAAFTHPQKNTAVGIVEGRLALVNICDKAYLLRGGTGMGVGTPQNGPSRTFHAGLSPRFNS